MTSSRVELTSEDERMATLVERYADLPPGTPGAAVTALAERSNLTEVATAGPAPRPNERPHTELEVTPYSPGVRYGRSTVSNRSE